MQFIDTNCTVFGSAFSFKVLNDCVLTLQYKTLMLAESQILSERLFQTATAECLKPFIVRTVSTT